MLDQIAIHLKCSSTCVRQCAALAPTMDEKSQCLELCGCYEEQVAFQQAPCASGFQFFNNEVESTTSTNYSQMFAFFGVALAALASCAYVLKNSKVGLFRRKEENLEAHYTLLRQ